MLLLGGSVGPAVSTGFAVVLRVNEHTLINTMNSLPAILLQHQPLIDSVLCVFEVGDPRLKLRAQAFPIPFHLIHSQISGKIGVGGKGGDKVTSKEKTPQLCILLL